MALRKTKTATLNTKKSKEHFIYILQTKDGRYYTGYTIDLKRRLDQHKSGKGAKFTKAFGVQKLLYHEKLPDKSSALKREIQIKRWPKKKKQALIHQNIETLKN